MHSYTCILDTRCKAQPKGIARKCAVCGRMHVIWACFRETELSLTRGFGATALPTGKTLIAGTGCAKKILEDKVPGIRVPIYEEEKLRNALLSGRAAHITPGDALYLQLYFEFGGTK